MPTAESGYWRFHRAMNRVLGRFIGSMALLAALFGAACKIGELREQSFECPDEDYAGKPQYTRTNPKTLRESCEDAIRQAGRILK
jgi:hypothetical protein